MTSQLKIICLMGPTASGKTELALRLAEKNKLEIISVDSAMVYRGMDIGTAKPSAAELALVPHHLIDICEPTEPYSVGQFCQDADAAIQAIHAKGAIPLLVGGTMMYFWALQNGLSQLPQADSAVRDDIYSQAQEQGWPAMHQRLQQIDAATAASLNPNDSQRISRALEVYELTGIPLSEHQQQAAERRPYEAINIILMPSEREQLHQRIAQRLRAMFSAGFIDEVEQFFNRDDCHADLPAMRTVGYRQIWQYLAGEYDIETMQQRALFATRQLAKRQITWLKRWPDALRFDAVSESVVKQLSDLMYSIRSS